MPTIRIRRKRRPDDPLELMEDIEVNEVSLVDQPATGEPFVLFKSASGKASFTSQPASPGMPSLRPPREAPESRGDRTPTMDEALGGLERILAATLEGDDSTVDDMGKKVPEGRDRDTFERCIAEVEEKTGDKGRAYAICTAGGAGEGKRRKAVDAHTHEVTLPDGSTVMTGPPVGEEPEGAMESPEEGGAAPYPPPEPGKRKEPKMRLKQDPPVPEDIAAAEEMPPIEGAGVLEIPATPTEWSMSACIDEATGLGLSEDQAVQVCQLVRQEYGDPADEANILVPQGESAEGLIGGAAVQLGFAELGGGASTPKRFTGKNRWATKFKQFLGLNPNRQLQVEQRDMVRLAKALKGVSDLMQKTKDDLRAYIEGQERQNTRLHEENQRLIGILARGMGVDMPEPAPVPPAAPVAAPVSEPASTVVSGAGMAPSAPLVAPGPPPAVLEAAAAGAGKAVKEGGMGALEERLALIEEALATLLAGGLMGGAPPAVPMGPDQTMAGEATAGIEPPLKRLLRTSVPAVTQVKAASGQDLEWSTVLNTYVSAADRAAAAGAGPLRHRR
jgi:hypothetical protein